MQLLLTFCFMLLMVTIMAIGVIMGRKPIKGSCGGVGAALGQTNYICDICGNDPNKCEKENPEMGNPARKLFYDATKDSEKPD